MRKKILLSIVLIIGGINGCSIFQSNEGLIILNVSFSQKGFTLKVIPKDTSNIKVEVTGEGLNSPINLSLTATEPSSIIKVPQGKKQVKATALNNTGKVLATDSESVDVIANATNTVRVKLQAVPDTGHSHHACEAAACA